MSKRNTRFFVGDFETTVYDKQEYTEVWASAVVELNTDEVLIHNSIEETYDYLKNLKSNVVIYYHNLKFDGAFWLSHLLIDQKLTQATEGEGDNLRFLEHKYMKNNTFKYSISYMGAFYSITIKVNNFFIEIRDSLKLLPFSVKRMGKAFKTKHQKLDMEYIGFRYAGCTITEEEKEYIKNDVLVVKECLEVMFAQGHNGLTIGSCCLKEYKNSTGAYSYDNIFPSLTDFTIDQSIYGTPNADAYIRKSYRGGWCYLKKGCENIVYTNGCTADVNSLYPSVMSSESGNRYPIGLPQFWSGNYIHKDAIGENKYYFVRFKCRFYIKKNKLPFIQIKKNLLYNPTEMLETSDIEYNGEHYRYTVDDKGNQVDSFVTMTMTMTDFKLFQEHYDLIDLEILDGCFFFSEIGLFDEYIEKYKKIKMESEGALRELAKLFLNNLYGKLSSSEDSSFKVAYVKENNVIGFKYVLAREKKAGYIAVGSAITSYARDFTIRTAQHNYSTFIYADTDSIHCNTHPLKLKNVKADDNAFCCWKLESSWDKAIFVRQKTYIEHITHENLKPVDKEYYNIKCAGMPPRCKDIFNMSMQGFTREQLETITETEVREHLKTGEPRLTQDEIDFIQVKRELKDFTNGIVIPSKLQSKRVLGGIVLATTTFEMR